jgi:membrane dipeptidase
VREIQGAEGFERVPDVDGLENPGECFENIVGWLVRHGFSDDDIRKLVGEKFLRALEEVWA